MKNIKTLKVSNLPRHIAMIMDGNGRWAKKSTDASLAGSTVRAWKLSAEL